MRRRRASADHGARMIGLAHLAIDLARLDRLEPADLAHDLGVLGPRGLQLDPQIRHRRQQVGTAQGRCLGKG